ncbi:integrase [Methylobacterium sp. J-026]|uniref:integrase n=1 Tax=Methylobacterium sp. J-026 TaxID=2836624 RepID=UPI001FBA358F|nr:integrase [Methylobacterium sp. J-026]MCJ2134938.1 integrase [Methylobacterium sp. J-026]
MDKPKIKAPGLKFRPRSGGWAAYWIPSPEAVSRGYPSSTVPLTRYIGTPELLADQCQRLQNDMLVWLDGLRRNPLAFDGSIGSVLRIYQTHEESPFHRLKPGSLRPYVTYLRRLEREIGDVRVDGVIGLHVKRWHAEWSEAGAKPAAGQMRIAVLKAALTFCIVAGHRSCRTLRDDIRELRLPGPRPRSLYATADQVLRAIAAAHALKRPSLALAYAVQFETALRQWDVTGQWYPLKDPTICAVVHGQHKWAGLEWRHIGEDLVLRYTPSKTRTSSGAEVVIDLRLCPIVLEEIARVPVEERYGPLIINGATGLPFTDPQFAAGWRRVRSAAKLPRELWSRDLRASAITEGRGGGAMTDDAAKVAGHSKPRTTADVYDRERLEAHRRFAAARLDRRTPKAES